MGAPYMTSVAKCSFASAIAAILAVAAATAALESTARAEDNAQAAFFDDGILDRVTDIRGSRGRARIAQLRTRPGGQSYGRWAVEWWQWALGVPAGSNPLFDETGENCDRRQVDDTWFLSGMIFFPGDEPHPVTRECTIPAGKALFFPLANQFFSALLDDPPEERTEEFLRSIAACQEPVQAIVEIDGFRIPRPERFSTGPDGSLSPLFNVQLPPDNIFGAEAGPGDEGKIPELVLSPSAEEGVYLYVFPLSPGDHVIHWRATGCTPGNVQDITYFLTVGDELS
ncbi:hypothetical protein [Ferruginivarius sediminum]|uniref:Uncharacterized protein n=1 Tax=Ferruginivarius sediminum TaxID=2661937 RepID=A0A369TE64_9PROT|nr:hypothetical protein [Ferruginivarius sediminum]RDD63560.1 hypothetical protein DRB17_03735 [Ferruginivarius sediminum]